MPCTTRVLLLIVVLPIAGLAAAGEPKKTPADGGKAGAVDVELVKSLPKNWTYLTRSKGAWVVSLACHTGTPGLHLIAEKGKATLTAYYGQDGSSFKIVSARRDEKGDLVIELEVKHTMRYSCAD